MKPLAAAVDDLPGAVAEARLRRLYAEHGRDVLAYALRRLGDPEDAADVLSETFLVAWRRCDEIPSGPAARLWLYAVARLTVANQRRGERRRERLRQRLRSEPARQLNAADHPLAGDAGIAAALDELAPIDREILRLTAWEELSPSEAGEVLGLSAVAARSRLHRARRRLRHKLAAGRSPTSPDLHQEEQ